MAIILLIALIAALVLLWCVLMSSGKPLGYGLLILSPALIGWGEP